MKKPIQARYISYLQSDLKQIFRDKALFFILFVPILFVLIIWFAIPWVEQEFIDVSEYYKLIIAFFCAMSVVLPAFIFSFLILDERDQGMFSVFKIMPKAPGFLFLYRIIMVIIVGTISCLLILLSNNLFKLTAYQLIGIVLLMPMIAPVIMFTALIFAKNKIEGVTVFKLLNFVLILPIAGFFIASPLKYLLGIVPVYWAYELFFTESVTEFLFVFIIGIIINASFITLFYKLFYKKVVMEN